MKEMFNRRQRFSLRKYSVGVCSVLLGTALFAVGAPTVAADGVSASTDTSKETVESVQPEADQAPQDTATTAPGETYAQGAPAPKVELPNPALAAEAKAATETPAAPEAKPAVEATPKAEVVAKPAVAEAGVTAEETAKPAEKAEEAKPAAPEVKPAAEAKPASHESNKPRVRNRRAVTNEAVTGDHNSNPVAVSTYLKDGEKVTPEIKDANGATVSSQPVPAGYARKEGDVYTYSIIDLTRFNERYNTNYYTRAYKRFDDSTETTVELIDKTTGNVVETRTLSASSGIQKFTTTTAASNGQLTVKYDYDKGLGAGAGKTDEPFIQFGYEVGASIQALVNPKNEAEQKLYQDVYNARTSTDIINVVEPAYNGRTITDSNAKIPKFVEKPTYYRVVDKNNATFNANKTDVTVQDYVPNGNEVDLAKYATKAMEGQHFTASGERQFDGYKLYQTANPDSTTGFVSRPYVVGTKFMDAERAGIKRIKEIVGEDGSVVVRVYLLDPKQQSKRSDGTLETDGYMLLAETKPIKPGDYNKQELAVKKSPLHTIPFTDSKGVNYPDGKEVSFDFQTAAGYTPKKTVFVPFLGDNIGHLSPNSQLTNGAYVQIGTNVDLLNSLTPYKPTVYYYVKQEPVEVTPEVEKQLEGRVLVDGEFTFKLTEKSSSPDKHEETVTNKDGKATFSKLTFNKVGTYTYTITETPGSDANVEYDAMTVTMTVKVTENAQGDLQATVKYSAEGGFKSGDEDKIFNNYVVAPVKTKFDFSKKLAGRELKDGEFNFVLKDSRGQEVETVANKKDGTVTFTELSFDNTKIGTHTYTVEEVIPATKEVGMTYDTMKATITVKVAKNGHTLTTVTSVSSTGGVDDNGASTDGKEDKVFNNKITPPETPEFQPEKFVLNKEKFDLTGTKLMDDDDELQDEYTETNANPYADQTKNNEAENINTKTVNRGDKLVYQVWLDTKNFTDKNNIQSVGISDTYDADKLTVNSADIKAYDSETGVDVTSKFDITVSNGVITATSKSSMNKSLGDADNTQVIDTTKFAFGRYYKFDIPATVKESVAGGVDIENKANQIVHVYNPVSKSVETPEKPTQKRVNSVPITAEFNFTKRLEGRALKAGEFTFELKDSDNVVIATVTNDADGKIKFSPVEYTNKAGEKVTALKYKKGQEGTYTYSVTEVKGADATVTYDTMKAEVTVTVSHDGTAKALVADVTEPADKEFNNTVTPPTEPKFQPEKYVLNTAKYSITDNKLLDDDAELTDKYGETNTDPYVDGTSNNEAENINTKTVNRGDKIYYQVWLDTTKFSANNKENVQSVGITDDFDETKVDVNSTKIKAYDSVTGDDVTNKFDIKVENGVMTATLKAGFTKSLGDAENTQIIDTTKFAFERYYKFDIPATVKADVPGGADIENTAAQVVNYYNPISKTVEKPNKPTEKRVNNVPISVEFNFTKKLEGRELKANEFSFVLKDSTGKVVETVSNDAAGNVKFSTLTFKKGQEGVHNYTVEEVKGNDATVTYDTMKANVTITVSHDGTAKALVANLGDIADKEFNNTVTPPTEPKFQPEKYVLNTEKYSITDNKLLDDDAELADKYGDTNTDPYVDKANNNEAENINTKTVNRGDKIYYQVWLDTTKFSANNKENVQSVGITDDFDETKVDVNSTKIKAYDSVTGDDVTNKFDIKVENGVMTATLKAGFTKSLGDAENTQIIDTTKFAFERYYKFDIPATVKADVPGGADIENTAAQVVNYYNPISKTVEKPNKPTEKRVNNVPISVEFNFTKKLEGRELKANEFSFVLKDSTGKVVETVSNDAAGNVKFSTLTFKKGQEGVHNYTVEEVKGNDATVTYDTMKANVTITVSHDGTAKALVANLGDIADKEFNNTVTPPTEPKFQPEKYVLNTEKYSITDNKLLDDDAELADKYGDTNTDPYVDKANNNEAENINTKTVNRGDKLVYQVWLDTTKFSADNKENIQSVGISDNYDEAKLELDVTKIKAYDSVSGNDVTDKFDIVENNGVITATLKAGFTKSLGDAENTQVIDTTKFEFGRYYKFDIPTTVKQTVKAGVDIENTAAQVVNYYNPTTKKVETPEKPTQKRVNNVPVPVEFNFTKKLEGRELKDQEFSFTLKDADGKVLETVKNDADGKVKFSAIEFKKGQEGTYNYTVEEVVGSDATVTYDPMVATVKVVVSHDGTAKALVTNVTDAEDKEFNNRVTPPEEPKFQPEKYVVSEEKFDITGDKLVDDDKELADKYADTNANPYADDASNNEKENLNTKTVKRGDKLVYQVWLDTTKFDAANKDNIQSVGISDNYDETKLDLDSTKIKAYDSVTGAEVTDKFDIAVDNGVITATLKDGFTKSLGDAENTQIIDTTKFEFGRYYKFDIPATVKDDVVAGADIENKAAQVVNYYNPVSKTVEKPNKPTEKRVNSVPISVEFNFTKKLEGRELKAGEFTFELKDSDNVVIATATNDAAGKIKFSPVEYTNKAGETVTALKYKKGQEGTYKYTVEEVKGTDATVTYDTMKAVVTVEVRHDGTAKALITNVTDPADKEFNNIVRPPEEPKFQPEKYVVSEEKFDITGDKLVDDDKELADKVADTNANPYADDASNNEKQNLNTKTVKRGDKLVYQVWLDTTKFDAKNKDNIQSVGISDDYDETKLDLDSTKIKAYDSVTGAEVTDKFDIAVNNGVITATLKAGFTKSLGDAENTQIIDTTKFAFGRYYKFDIPTTVKADVPGGVDIENTAAQVVNYYNPTTKKVEKPSKPTEKRVNNVPVSIEFNFTKKLEGRELQANEFSFVLKDSEGKTLETVSNDAAGNVKFSALEFKKGQEGVHNYTVEEVKGSDATVTYDTMKANVTVTVSHDGTAKVLVATVGDIADKEFNNRVTPPETPEFNPEKYILNESKFDITGDKLVDDDKELADKVADTNKDPYADKVDNNEAQNINTKTLKKGDKVYYQVWLDTTKFTEAHNIQSVGVTDKYDSENLDVNVAEIKAYDSVTGEDVTAKFDIKVENGVITATSKTDLTKSLGDAENTPVIDTAKLAFGRYYKFEIPATIKATAKDGVDIENTASQTVHQYDPTKKSVEKPEKPTEKRVVNIPTKVEFNFTKKLEGRELKEGEFSFVLKDKDGKVIETVKNDASGNIKFSALEFKRGDEETKTYTYTVEEVKGTEAGVEYDKMVATVTVTVTKEGKVLTATSQLPEDTEFNNKVIPPKPPVTPPTPPVTPPTPPVTPPTPPVTPPTPPVTPPTPPVTPPTPPVTPPAPELPSTGEEQSASAALLGAALGLVGLAGLARRKKNED
ncbi:YSIRK signal domain/LPXTG anchor domain surface protein [Streptococcus ilei]|uniref:YSIRK signal domain/LPXTG anchor domain surface protein n=1 Tax=Streptococcus ilei TaxID=1156431 RepID=UPI0003B92F61|nr:YSIRK signal domain/LPXTG anchor domain surface protein [Streptococcus ilei]AGY40424.1 YSIRK type signal peptide [Streptococcus ilei]